MPGKRKRPEAANALLQRPETVKPLSAVAAARLKANASAQPDHNFKSESLNPLPESPVTDLASSDEHSEQSPVKSNIKLCSWRYEPQNVLSETSSSLVVKLDKHSTIALVGCYQLTVLKGAVNINGANLGASSYDGRTAIPHAVFVPSTGPVLKIRGLDSVNHVQISSTTVMMPLENLGLSFKTLWAPAGSASDSRSFFIVTDSQSDPLGRPLLPEKTPEDWLRTVEECTRNPFVTCIVGASQSGKSTFAKRLLNRYLSGQGKAARPLSAVCFLDLDPAQTEYTPPGQISLINVRKFNLGPCITHAAAMPMSNELGHNQVVRAHPLPLDTINHATYYISCAEDLFLAYQKLRSRDPSLPLVINTSGAVYDSSFNVLQTLLSLLKPHNLIHLCDLQAINADNAPRLDSLHAKTAQHHGSVFEVTAMAESEPRQLSKAESRAMQVQSYFHLRDQVAEGYEISRWLPDDISRLKPWEFCYQGSQGCSQDFLGFAVYTEPVESASLAHFLDGTLVQVVQLAPNAQLHIDISRTARFCIPFFAASRHKGIVDPLDPANSTLICTGLVRGFDPQRKVVQILFPRAYEGIIFSLVPDRTVLVGGCCESPEWAYVEGENRATMLCSSKSYGTDTWPDSRPWVESGALVEAMGFLNTVRRVRKFQT